MRDRQETSQHWRLRVHLAWWCSQNVDVGSRSWSLPGSSNDVARPRESDGEFVLLPTTRNQIHQTLTSDIYNSSTREQFHHLASWLLLQQHFSRRASMSNQSYAGNTQFCSTTHTVAPGMITSSETDCTGYQFNIVQCLCTGFYTVSLLHTSPDSMSNNPSLNVATSWYAALSQHDLVVPATRTQFGERSFTVAGPSTWNSLPDFGKDAESLDIFKPDSRRILSANFMVSDILLLKRPVVGDCRSWLINEKLFYLIIIKW